MSAETVRVAAIQATPVPFEREASVARACELVAAAGAQGVQLALLPEAFVPAYPRGLGFGTVVGGRSPEGRALWERYWSGSVEVPGPQTDALGKAARAAGLYLAIGVIERGGGGDRGTLYCTLLYFGPDGGLLGVHRKLKPTAAERLIWGEGDGSTLTAIDTPFGTVGGLICWENYMPLARTAMYDKGVDIYLAPTADDRDTWQSTLRHIACEGRCFVIGCNQYVSSEHYPDDIAAQTDDALGLCRGGSAIVGPLGEELAGPVYGREETRVADLDLGAVTRSRFDFDAVGHYARPDVFRLQVNERRQVPVQVDRGEGGQD